MVGAITVVLLCQLAGEAVVRLFGLPLPGPVVGMVFLFLGLVIRGGVPDGIEQVSRTILRHLGLLFVPACVGIMAHVHAIAAEAVPIAAAVLGSTLLTLVVTGHIMQALERRPPDIES